MKLRSIVFGLLVVAAVGVGTFFVGRMFGMHGGMHAGMDMSASMASGPKNGPKNAQGDRQAADDSSGTADEVLYWVAPMDANFRRDSPGKSPMGMDLVPVYAGGGGGNPDADVSISATMVQNLGVRTALVEQSLFAPVIKTVGYTGWNESTITMLHTRVEGWLEQFNIANIGQRVSRGETLFAVFSPKLVSAQQEYLTAKRSGNRSLIRASVERLRSLGASQSQIDELARGGEVQHLLPHLAHRGAIVADLNVRPGMYVMPETNIATLVDDSSLWLRVEIFESDAGVAALGQSVDVRFTAFPGELFTGRVEYIYPEIDPVSRTLQLRVLLQNPDGRLKANMYASAVLRGTERSVLSLPREAVIRSGAGSRVIVDLGDGGFKVMPVKIGRVSNDRIELVAGVAAGDRVVTSGQFLLDAEANGEQAVARINAEKQLIPAFGVIEEIKLSGAVTITHEPIPELNWPVMTMDFMAPADSGAKLQSLVGQPIEFSIQKNTDGAWNVMEFRKRSSTMDGATDSMRASPVVNNSSALSSGSKGFTKATVVAVDQNRRRLELDHQAIESIGMSAMTMRFNVTDNLPLAELQPGDHVRFIVEMKAGSGLLITRVEKTDKANQP